MKKVTIIFLLALLVSSVAQASEVTYSEHIKQVFMEKCNSCHGASSPEYKVFKQDKENWESQSIGPRMDSYTYLVYFTGWPDTGALMRRLDDAKPGNMYQHLGSNDKNAKKT